MRYILHHPAMGFLLRYTLFTAIFGLTLAFPGTHSARAQSVDTFTILPLTSAWKYNASGLELGTSWRNPGYDDSTWPSGPVVLAFEDNNAFTLSLTNTILPLHNEST